MAARCADVKFLRFPANSQGKGAAPVLCVDGFQFASAAQTEHYFLTHFHADHTVGLTRNFQEGHIYCSPVTARLVTQFIGVDSDRVHALPLDQPVDVAGVRVTLVDANHCPGAVVFIFHHEESGRTVVHSGDFRAAACVCEGIRRQLHLQDLVTVDELYLDTTYASPRWSFPAQEEVLEALSELCASEAKKTPRTLFVVGSYQIGKERAAAAIGRGIGSSVYVNARRWQMLEVCGWTDERVEVGGSSGSSSTPTHAGSSLSSSSTPNAGKPSGGKASSRMLFTTDSKGCSVRMDGMMGLTHDRLLSTLEYTKGIFDSICAFRPTGWTYSKRWRNFRPWVENNGATKIFNVPYSEHSSFTELRALVCELRPRKIVPTVNIERRQQQIDLFASSMDLSEDREHMDWYLGAAAQGSSDSTFVDVLRLSVGAAGPDGPAEASSAAIKLAGEDAGGCSRAEAAGSSTLPGAGGECDEEDDAIAVQGASGPSVDPELSQVDLEKQRRLLRFFEQQQAAKEKRAAFLAGPAKRPPGSAPMIQQGRTSGKKQKPEQASRKSGKRAAGEPADAAAEGGLPPPRKAPRAGRFKGRAAASGGGAKPGAPARAADAAGAPQPPDNHARGHRFIAKPSAQLRERINRAFQHRMYLLAVHPKPGDAPCAVLDVLGSTGNVYHVHMGRPRQSCTCADHAKHTNMVCKHILFVMLRVCKLQREDPRVWQVALTPSEAGPLVDAMPSREGLQADAQGSVVAGPEILRGFDAVSGDAALHRHAGAASSSSTCVAHARRPLQEEDCPICFEPFEEEEDASVEFCRACGNNAHADCMRRWRQAKGGDCPLCRAPWPDPVAAGGCPQSGEGGDGSTHLNLSRLAGSSAPSLEELYPETAQWIRRRNAEKDNAASGSSQAGERSGRLSASRPVPPQHSLLAAFRKSANFSATQQLPSSQGAAHSQEGPGPEAEQPAAAAVGSRQLPASSTPLSTGTRSTDSAALTPGAFIDGGAGSVSANGSSSSKSMYSSIRSSNSSGCSTLHLVAAAAGGCQDQEASSPLSREAGHAGAQGADACTVCVDMEDVQALEVGQRTVEDGDGRSRGSANSPRSTRPSACWTRQLVCLGQPIDLD